MYQNIYTELQYLKFITMIIYDWCTKNHPYTHISKYATEPSTPLYICVFEQFSTTLHVDIQEHLLAM